MTVNANIVANSGIVKGKDNHIETLRGIAILSVIVGHVIGSGESGGMRVADDSMLRWLYGVTWGFQLPLFTAIAGWVYALRPQTRTTPYWPFMGKKAIRLLLPMLFVGATYFLLQYITPGTNTKMPLDSIWRIAVLPYTIYWYLPALFLLFGVSAVLDRLGGMDRLRQWSVVMLLSLGLCFAELLGWIPREWPNYFAVKGMCYLMPYFVLGVGMCRFRAELGQRKYVLVYLLLAVTTFAVQQLNFFFPEQTAWYDTWQLKVLVGMSIAALLVNVRFDQRWLVWVAAYSYALYLFHGFGTSGGRILLTKLGVTSSVVIFCGSLVCAIVLPIVADRVLTRIPLLGMLFLGKIPKKKL